MKKNFCLFSALLFAAVTVFADEATLIDFTLLNPDIMPNGGGVNTQNRRTVMDYSMNAGPTFTQDQQSLMKTSLAYEQWVVSLNSSARNTQAFVNSIVRAAPVKESAGVPFAGQNVMGVRILFPTLAANSSARVTPPIEIPAYEPLSTADENGDRATQTPEEKATGLTLFEKGADEAAAFGVVKNVGTIKSISVTTMGNIYPHRLYVLLKDADGIERRYFMGSFEFDGWKELIWNNSHYISDVRAREIRVVPVYPRGMPYAKFVGFEITRDAMKDGGDFIGYFKDVKIIYDRAVLNADRDIADEDLWGIITKRENERQESEMRNFGEKQVNQFIESQLLATETDFTSSVVQPQQQPQN
ncbi:MAG: flagellar filament outer layer protein FlaA [Treponemataceae bacterium]|nr:MAG: flagellar filament outer layer protein FlaA [Treponemataceae bacterium]